MRIARITVANHSRVADFDVEVRNHVVFVGSNASGKSTVLALVDATLGASWSRLMGWLDPSHLRDPDQALVVEVRLDGLDADDEAHFADKIEVAKDPSDPSKWLNLRLTASVSPTDHEQLEISRSFVKPLVEDQPATRADLDAIGWWLLRANRSADRELSGSRTSAIAALFDGVKLSAEETQAIADALGTVSETLDSTQGLIDLREQMASEFSKLFPTEVQKDEIAFDLPSSLTGELLTDLDVQLDRAGQRVSLGAQSDGLRSLAVMALYLLAQSSAKILAIDEPEVHLHPRSQANIGALLAASPGQRLVATHAPPVLAQFPPSAAVSLTPKGARQLANPLFPGTPKQREHWWVESALEPLTADKVILVEGISDRILVHAVARHLGEQLDRRGVSVVSLGGAGQFAPALSLFGPKGFGVPVLGLVDEKEAPIPAEELGVTVADLDALDILICHADLEEEYLTALGVTDVVGFLLNSAMFKEAGLLQMTGHTTIGDITPATLTEQVLRKSKHKVNAAMAVAEGMSTQQAVSITTVVELVRRAAS